MNAIDRFRPFEDWEAEQMQDPEFVAALAAREPGYQVTRLRLGHAGESGNGALGPVLRLLEAAVDDDGDRRGRDRSDFDGAVDGELRCVPCHDLAGRL